MSFWARCVLTGVLHSLLSHCLCSTANSILLRALGVVDVAGTDVGDNEVLVHALMNVSQKDKQAGWAVRRSGNFLNEYGRTNEKGEHFLGTPKNANHLLGTFPCLFLYGQGGFEVERKQAVSYTAHTCWCLRYAD